MRTHLTCKHLIDGRCQIADELGQGISRLPDDTACRACLLRVPPMSINKVTLDLAIGGNLTAKRRDVANALMVQYSDVIGLPRQDTRRLDCVRSGTGVGSQIWRLLEEIGVKHDSSCDCLVWAEKLNAWGIAGCRLTRTEIIDHLGTARQEYGWARSIQAASIAAAKIVGDLVAGRKSWLNPLDPYGSIIDEASRRAEEAELKKASDEFDPDDDHKE